MRANLKKSFECIRHLNLVDDVEVLEAALHEPDEEIKACAYDLLCRKKSSRAAEIVVRYFSGLPESIRAIAKRAMHENYEFLPKIMISQDARVRLNALELLDISGAVTFDRTIVSACLLDSDPQVRERARSILKKISEEYQDLVARANIGALNMNKDELRRAKRNLISPVVAALTSYADHRCHMIIDILLDCDDGLHSRLTEILENPRDRRSSILLDHLSNSANENVPRFILKLLCSGREDVRHAGIEILRTSREPDFHATFLRRILMEDMHVIQRLSQELIPLPWLDTGLVMQLPADAILAAISVVSFSRISEKAKVQFLLDLYERSPELVVRQRILIVLGEAGVEEVYDHLFEALKSPDEKLARVALNELIEGNRIDAVEILKILPELAENLRKRVLRYLLEIGIGQYNPRRDRAARSKIARTVNTIARLDHDFAQFVRDEMTTLHTNRRIAIIGLLSELDPATHTAMILFEFLSDPEQSVRSEIIKAFGRMRTTETVAWLKGLLGEEDARIRSDAIEALGVIGGYGELLRPFMNDPGNRVRGSAIRALAREYPRDAEQALMQMLLSTDEKMRLTAAWLVAQLKFISTAERLKMMAVSDPSPAVRERSRRSLLELTNAHGNN